MRLRKGAVARPRVSQGVAPSPLPLGSEYAFPHPHPSRDARLGTPESGYCPAQAIPYGLEDAELAIVVTRFFHSAGVVELSCGNSAAAITSFRTLVITTNSRAAFGFAASSSLANSALRHSV